MSPEQWISVLEKTYDFHGATLTEQKKQILLTPVEIPEPESIIAELKADKLIGARTTPTNQDIVGYRAMIAGGVISLEEAIPQEFRTTTEELKDILIKEFFHKVSREETFGDESRIEEKQKSMFERYRLSHGPFVNMARTFLTFTTEIKDLFPEYCNLILSQILSSVLTTIRGVFLPSDGPYKHPLKERIRAQEKLLKAYAPTFDREGYFKNNPVLEELRAKEVKWAGVAYIIICLVLAWFVPQGQWWGKIIFLILIGIIFLCLCSIFPVFKRIIFGKTNKGKA